jgi:asparagine synthase (glutamine-hydrolysing)
VSVIAGVWSFEGKLAADSMCRRMLDALSLYGMEGKSQYSSPGFAMGRCLLRLLPEDDFDQQPLSARGVTALVAEVRLDNRAELAAELDISTEALARVADSAVLLAAWQKWGEACPEHLNGAFSFAVWEEAEQRLFLARDHTGERPLYYSTDGHGFAFASMPKGLHSLPFVGAEVDLDYVARYLTLANIPIEQTIFRRIHRLPAGSALSVSRAKARMWRYWRTDRLAELRLGSADEYLACFRERFDRGVRSRLRSRGNVGALLSGGLDSGSVAATAAGMLAQGRVLSCFTAVPGAGFQDSDSTTHFGNEGSAAAEVAARYSNVRHFCIDSSAVSFLDILDQHNDLYDHPCFGPSNEVWLHAILDRAQAAGITVMLNGHCGNATFSSYGVEALAAWFDSGNWATLARIAWQLRQTGHSSVRAILRHAVGPALPFWLRSKVDPHMRGFSLDYSMLRPELARQMDLERIAFHDMNQTVSDGRGTLRSLLAYGDVSGTPISGQGGWGVDFRDPTFDRWVVEFCLTAPLEEFLRGGEQRSLARRAMAGRLPESTLKQSRRGLQSADWYVSMGKVRGRMLEQVRRLEGSPLARSVIDLERMRSLIENWPSGGFDQPEVMRSHHIALTRGFSVGMFLMSYDGGKERRQL